MQHDRLVDEQVSELKEQVWLAARLADKHLEVVQQSAVAGRSELGLESGADRIRSILSDAAARSHAALEAIMERARQLGSAQSRIDSPARGCSLGAEHRLVRRRSIRGGFVPGSRRWRIADGLFRGARPGHLVGIGDPLLDALRLAPLV